MIPSSIPIEPVSQEGLRPLWSVMIPTFNCANYLRQTLESALAQDPGEGQMQIEVVDDCSAKDDPEAVVQEVGKGRVTFYRRAKNEGPVPNFNTCLQRSRGHLVHILHGDDYVLPGFYETMAKMAESHPDVSGFFARCMIVDENGALNKVSDRLAHLTQPSKSPESLFYVNDLPTPGAVIRRSFYETYGGFMPGLIHVADWEMWIRVIQKSGALWVNEPLAAYRLFPGNDTGRLARTAENLRDCLRLAQILELDSKDFDPARFREEIAHRARFQEKYFNRIGDHEAAAANYRLWCELTPLILQWAFYLRDRIRPVR